MKISKIIKYLSLAATCFLMLISMPALADTRTDFEKTAHEVYTEVLSPFCPGRALAECPSGKAEELRQQILQEIQAGKSKDEVLQEIFNKYGEKFRAVPELHGKGYLAWLLPIGFFAIGLLLVVAPKIFKRSHV